MRRQDAAEVVERLNPWQLNLDNSNLEAFDLLFLTADVRGQICEAILDVTSKKEHLAVPFLNRVTQDIAKDYVYLVPGEMWISLILERLSGNYYRSMAQVHADLDSILENCAIYNGVEHELYNGARKIVLDIKRSLKSIEPSPPMAKEEALPAGVTKQMKVSDTKVSIPFALINGSRQRDDELKRDLD